MKPGDFVGAETLVVSVPVLGIVKFQVFCRPSEQHASAVIT